MKTATALFFTLVFLGSIPAQASDCLIKTGKYLKGISRYATPKPVSCVQDSGASLAIAGKEGFNLDIPYGKIKSFGGEVARGKNVTTGEAVVFGGWAYLKAKEKTFKIEFVDTKGRTELAEFKFAKKDMDKLAQHLDSKVK